MIRYAVVDVARIVAHGAALLCYLGSIAPVLHNCH
jgi:hypothetical protein